MGLSKVDTTRINHIAYADESYYTSERFRSIAVVTLESSNREAFSLKYRSLLDGSGIVEFKWNKLRQARERFAAIKLIDETIQLAENKHIRVDVLIWDTYDSRHQILKRDDIANLQRMYYHIFRNVLHRRWPPQSSWLLLPDENSALDWATVQDYLDTAGISIKITSGLFEPFSFRISREFQIIKIEEVSSKSESICQVADLFAGLGAYSHSLYEKYNHWLFVENGQLPLAIFATKNPIWTNSEIERFQIMKYLDEKCKSCRLRVSLKSAKGFKTFDPRFPINFWPYKPHQIEDKAPTTSTSN